MEPIRALVLLSGGATYFDFISKMRLTLLLLEHNIIIEGNFLSYTLIKMCFASEVESAMECGEHRGSQR